MDRHYRKWEQWEKALIREQTMLNRKHGLRTEEGRKIGHGAVRTHHYENRLKHVAKLTGRTYVAIQRQAQRMGLPSRACHPIKPDTTAPVPATPIPRR